MNRVPVVLLHGVWLHMSSWKGWAERFTAHGYAVHVPNWPGEADAVAQARRNPGPPGGFGLDELTAHCEKTVRALDSPPVLIGHSAGGLIARRLLEAGLARAAVAIAPLPDDGLAAEELRPRLWPPVSDRNYIQLPQPLFRHTIANTVGDAEAATLFHRYAVPAPHRLLVDLRLDGTPAPEGSANSAEAERGPLLLISGQEDRLVADAVTRATYKLYGDSTAVTDLKQFADKGHSLVIDSGWPAVADCVLGWLAANGITAQAERERG